MSSMMAQERKYKQAIHMSAVPFCFATSSITTTASSRKQTKPETSTIAVCRGIVRQSTPFPRELNVRELVAFARWTIRVWTWSATKILFRHSVAKIWEATVLADPGGKPAALFSAAAASLGEFKKSLTSFPSVWFSLLLHISFIANCKKKLNYKASAEYARFQHGFRSRLWLPSVNKFWGWKRMKTDICSS